MDAKATRQLGRLGYRLAAVRREGPAIQRLSQDAENGRLDRVDARSDNRSRPNQFRLGLMDRQRRSQKQTLPAGLRGPGLAVVQRGGWSDRSCIWHKNLFPNRYEWFVNDWEFVLAFKKPDSRPPFNWKSVAHPPKRRSTETFSHRNAHGVRQNIRRFAPNELARPRDVIRVAVGGGHLGHPLAHENEAPFPLKLAKHFIEVCSNPDDTVLDPFLGSGTTLHACKETKRKGIGIDIRESQVELSERRLKNVKSKKRA